MPHDGNKDEKSAELPAPVQVVESFERFFKKAVRGSYLLFMTTLAAIVWANLSTASYKVYGRLIFPFQFAICRISMRIYGYTLKI
jgi:hypothetical protein